MSVEADPVLRAHLCQFLERGLPQGVSRQAPESPDSNLMQQKLLETIKKKKGS